MTSIDLLQRLLEEVGPATEEVEEVLQHTTGKEGAGAWTVRWAGEEELEVTLDFVPDQEKLVLGTSLGAPPEARRAACLELALLYNFNWADSGGLKIGLDAPGAEGGLELMFDAGTAQLDLPGLQNVLTNFAHKATVWRRLVAAGAGADAKADTTSQADSGTAFGTGADLGQDESHARPWAEDFPGGMPGALRV